MFIPILQHEAGGCHSLDGIFAQIDQRNIGLIEDLVEAVLKARSFGAECVRRLIRREYFCDIRILDARASLIPPKLIGGLIRRFIEEHVGKGTDPEVEAPLAPKLLIARLALFLRDFQGRFAQKIQIESAECVPAHRMPRRIFSLQLCLRLRVELALRHAQRKARRALEDGHMSGDLRGLLYYLHGTGARTNDTDPLVSQIYTGLRPQARMVFGAFEALETRNVRDVRLCREARTKDHKPAPEALASARLERPRVLPFVEGHGVHACVELRVLSDVPLLVDKIEVAPQLLITWIKL